MDTSGVAEPAVVLGLAVWTDDPFHAEWCPGLQRDDCKRRPRDLGSAGNDYGCCARYLRSARNDYGCCARYL